MAIETFMPYVASSDMMPLLACLDLLGESGHVMPPSTFRLHAKRRRILVEKRGRTPYVSFSDAAEIHRDWAVSRQR